MGAFGLPEPKAEARYSDAKGGIKMTRKKILLAYITKDSGHHKAALAIEEALCKLSGGDKLSKKLGSGIELVKLGNGVEIFKVDFLKHLHRFVGPFVERTYLQMLKQSPQTWEYLYDNPQVYSRLEKWIDRLSTLKSWRWGRLTKLIDEFEPDIICCTQAFPALLLAKYKEKVSLKMISTPIVGVLTDYFPHRYWVHPNIDFYVVPSEEAGRVLMERGVKEWKIRDFGIPIDPKFRLINRLNKGEILKKLGFNEAWPVVLVMGGGRGLGPIKEVVEELEKSFLPLHLVVVCGRNKKLRKKLEKIAPFLHYPAKILGYVENINELMKVSSVVITKPGGLTISECLACGLPMILVNPIPGQEALNAQFLGKHNLAITVPDGKEVAAAAIRLLKDEPARQQMRAQARVFSRPDAALFIANSLIKGWA